jgi:propanediol dehydratase small subunit
MDNLQDREFYFYHLLFKNKFMEKLTETINALKVSKSTKDTILKIAEIEQLHIQQVCRRLLTSASKKYLTRINTSDKFQEE